MHKNRFPIIPYKGVKIMFTLKFNHNLQNIWITNVVLDPLSDEDRIRAFISMLLQAADLYENQINALDEDKVADEKLVVIKVLDKTGGKHGKPLGEVRIRMHCKEIVLISRRLRFTCEMLGCPQADVNELMINENVNLSIELLAAAKKTSRCLKLAFDKREEKRVLKWSSTEIIVLEEPKKPAKQQ